VLVIDDSDATRKFLRLALGRAGWEVLEAVDHGAAPGLARDDPVDLILLDLFLPDADPFALLAALRGLPGGERRPVLALSGWLKKIAEAQAAGLPFAGYLAKPIHLDDLLCGRPLRRPPLVRRVAPRPPRIPGPPGSPAPRRPRRRPRPAGTGRAATRRACRAILEAADAGRPGWRRLASRARPRIGRTGDAIAMLTGSARRPAGRIPPVRDAHFTLDEVAAPQRPHPQLAPVQGDVRAEAATSITWQNVRIPGGCA
jgi:CheY-like chemotaxis protein